MNLSESISYRKLSLSYEPLGDLESLGGSESSGGFEPSGGSKNRSSFYSKYLSLVVRNICPLMIFYDVIKGAQSLSSGDSGRLKLLKIPSQRLNIKQRILQKCTMLELFGKIWADVTGFLLGTTSLAAASIALANGISFLKAFGLIMATVGLSTPIGLAIFGGIFVLGLVISVTVLVCNTNLLNQRNKKEQPIQDLNDSEGSSNVSVAAITLS